MKILAQSVEGQVLSNHEIRLQLYNQGYVSVKTDEHGYFELDDKLEGTLISTSIKDSGFSTWTTLTSHQTLKIQLNKKQTIIEPSNDAEKTLNSCSAQIKQALVSRHLYKGYKGDRFNFNIDFSLLNIDISNVSSKTLKKYFKRLGDLGTLGRLDRLQHFSLALQLPSIDSSNAPPQSVSRYLQGLGEFGMQLGMLGMHGHGYLQHFSLALQLPSIDISNASSESVNSYLYGLGELGELGRLGDLGRLGMHDHGDLQHFSLNLQLPSIDSSNASSESVSRYLHSLGGLGRLGMFGMHDQSHLQHFSLSLQLPSIDISNAPPQSVSRYLQGLGEFGMQFGMLGMLGMHGHGYLQHFSLNLQLPSIDSSNASSESVSRYLHSLGGLGRLGMFGMHDQSHLQHFSLSLQLPSIDISNAPAESVSRYLESLGELGKLGKLGTHGHLQHFSFNLHLPNLEISKIPEITLERFFEKMAELKELGELKCLQKSSLCLDFSEFRVHTANKTVTKNFSKQLFQLASQLSFFSIRMKDDQLSHIQRFIDNPFPPNIVTKAIGEKSLDSPQVKKAEATLSEQSSAAKVLRDTINIEEEKLFLKIIYQRDDKSLDTLISDKLTRKQESVLGATILHLCTQHMALLMGDFSEKNADADQIQEHIIYFKNTIFRLIAADRKPISMKNNEHKLPIQIMAEYCPMIVNKKENTVFDACMDMIFACAEQCHTGSAESTQALDIIKKKLTGQYPKVLLPSSDKYVFWQPMTHKEPQSASATPVKELRK